MSKWPTVILSDVLRHRKEFITINDLTSYKRPRVRLHVQGIVLRDEVPGALIKTKTQQVCRVGEFLVAEIDAKVGGFGIVPESLDGSIVSSHYFLFVIDETKLDQRFLDFFIRTPAFREQVAAQGSTNYAAIRPTHVLGYEAPLPPLAEQRRVVARIEELASQIHEGCTLRHQSAEEAEALALATRNRLFENELCDVPAQDLDSIVTVVRGSSPRPKGDLRYYGGPVPRLLIADITRDGKYVTPRIDSLTEEGARLSRPMKKGSLVLAISGSYGLPAFLAVDACVHDGFIGFRDVSERVDPEYLYQVMVWRKPYFDSVVKNSGLQNLTTTHLKRMSVPVPPLDGQRRIVTALAALEAEADELKRLQAETAAELDALLPAVLDKAFKGKL